MWTIEPYIPMGLWWALAVASAAVITLYAVRRDWSLSPIRRGVVTALMGLGMVGPLLIALNPTWIEPIPPPPGRPLIAVLIDGTMSMTTADAEQGAAKSRWQAAREIARQVRSSSQIDVAHFAFDHQVHPLSIDAERDGLQESDEQWPRGHRTDLASSLRESMRAGTGSGHAVLLVSDGAHNVGSMESLSKSSGRSNSSADSHPRI